MSDIEKSFAFLQGNIPQWLQDITRVEEKVTAMQDDMVKMPVSMSPFLKRPTDSVDSIPRGQMAAIAEEPSTSHAAPTDPIGNRKRKTLSVLSGRASGPSRLRRTMVVVNYDGDMQKSLELLVRAIGTGRNLLRKAKMEAKMNELAALAASSEDEDEADDDEDEAIMAKISYRPRMSSMRVRAAARRGGSHGASESAGTPVVLFDTTDKTLEQAQSLCEKAAHVTLRDGDCRKELNVIRKSLADVLETAKIEVTKSNTAGPQEPQDIHAQDSPDTSLSSVEPSYQKHFPHISLPPSDLQSRSKNLVPSIPATMIPATSQIVDIEVDDDDEEDDELDFVMPVRFTSRFATRA